MTNAKNHVSILHSCSPLVSVLLMSIVSAPVCMGQQSQPSLQITSPTAGTIVNPGQNLTVSVASPTNSSFSQVGVIGEDPIGVSGLATSVPAQFSMTIPTDIACRRFMLTAVGTNPSGQSAHSTTIFIDVERPDMPTALSTQIPGLSFEVLGEQFPLILFAKFPDGSILEVTRSSYVTYSSSNAAIATVDANGIVTGGSAGTATVTATYTLNGQSVTTAVPVAVPPPVMTVSPTSLNFGSQNVGTSSSTQQLTVANTGNGSLKILKVAAAGDFTETDNCSSSSPLPVTNSCTISVTFMPTAAGSRIGSVSITNGFNAVPATVSLSGTGVGQPATATSLTSSANPAILAQSVTFTASVSPSSPSSNTPTGTVTFSDGSTTLASEPVTNDQATFSTSSLAVGAHSITASYSGDSNFLGSTSAALNQSVQYEPAGATCDGDIGHQILQPIHTDGSSVFKQGQTVPAKFRVCDANGVSIGTAGTVTSFLLTQTISGTVTTNVQDIVDTNNPDTAFRWDPTDQQWIFNISTQNLSANSTYIYTITLNDGTVISFQYGLR